MGVKVILVAILPFLVGGVVDGLGVNWGTQSTHPLPPDVVVRLLRANGFQKVKLFDADSAALNALSGSGIEVMVGIPNDMLAGLAAGVSAAEKWVAQNVSSYVSSNSVDIRYVAVGNEPFLSTLNGTYESVTLPAMQNIQAALIRAGLGGRIKVTVPLNADVYQSSTQLPSSGDFRPDIHGLMLQIVAFLTANASPFTVNIYPFISLYDDPNFPSAYAFFDDGYAYPIVDGGRTYANVFDANHDTLVWALQNNGFDNVTIVVGEIGWPTDGNVDADPGNAERFNQGFVGHAAAGTPMRPGPIDAYLFSLVDEDAKSIRPGNFERHWGLFYYDGGVKYNLTLNPNSPSGQLAAATGVEYLPRRWCVMSPSASPTDPQLAPSVSYACAMADCTSLGYGTSCGFLNAAGNVSYAFNSYYQINDQLGSACRFPDGLSVVTDVDPSVGTCRFDVMIRVGGSGSSSPAVGRIVAVLMLSVVFL